MQGKIRSKELWRKSVCTLQWTICQEQIDSEYKYYKINSVTIEIDTLSKKFYGNNITFIA